MLQLNAVNFAFKERRDDEVHTERSRSVKAKTLLNISLQIEQGKHVAIMGESGCGKSTLLNVIYGLLQAQSGEITWNDQELKGADYHLVLGHPMMKYIPQEFDLMPFTSVSENIGEHLSIQLDDRKERIESLLEVVEMTGMRHRKVKTLSGGQKQRVAIAKALAQKPELLLLDEPFSHVDNFRKNSLRRRLFDFLKSENISCLIATHDRNDVLSFTDQTIVMHEGNVVDHRPTKILYTDPKTKYVASLFDDVNQIPKEWFRTDGDLLKYPHELQISKSGLSVVVRQSYFKGDHFLLACHFQGETLWVKSNSDYVIGSQLFIELNT
ncbi:ABC transporter ATP-binding protein [Nonlabens marinus]|uniref:Putative iron-uptake ABC transport system ATP-binding protein n=1 Tax=Nonlabens marinus S1-08 TaxID=1454201 RepID=W8VQ19_9FLAO|nr:ABC transporter ATP-binding protein [Nonlabens marinus]BAO54795.1 putative iron-uptake ABC transport system ATP-binding protein [Nonlabens marinus S1-08]